MSSNVLWGVADLKEWYLKDTGIPVSLYTKVISLVVSPLTAMPHGNSYDKEIISWKLVTCFSETLLCLSNSSLFFSAVMRNPHAHGMHYTDVTKEKILCTVRLKWGHGFVWLGGCNNLIKSPRKFFRNCICDIKRKKGQLYRVTFWYGGEQKQSLVGSLV